MKIENLALDGLKLVQLDVYGDSRGFFVERFHTEKLKDLNLTIAQVNHSRSSPGVLRGLHYQMSPAQGKLVGVTRGSIWDCAVDLREGSSTYGKHYGTELSDTNGKLLWIPPGFAHGFCVLGTETADLLYFVSAPYNPQGEGGIKWNDSQLNIKWPCDQPQISARDEKLPLLEAFTPLRV